MPAQKTKEVISKNISRLMTENDMNNSELSKALGVSESTVGKWILMKAIPRMGVVEQMAKIFGVNKSDILEEGAIALVTEKDEKDIAKTMAKMKEQLQNEQGLMFDGELMDEETVQLVLEEIERQERIIKAVNKKYIPKKYR